MWDLAQEIASGGSAEEIGAVQNAVDGVRGALVGARDAVGEAVRKLRRAGLHKALRAMAQQCERTFDITREDDTYLVPAQAAAERGFEVIVYGHTHLPKNVELQTRQGRTARYLNTGTWADLIRIPDAVYAKDDHVSSATLDEFIADLEKDDVARWRRPAPTFAQIELEGQVLLSADLRFADLGASESVTTAGFLKRLAAKDAYG
jgi:hypothetical protein